MSRPLRITVGRSRLSPRLQRKKVSWEKLCKRLQKYQQIDHTYEQYLALGREQQSALKDVGYFIGGQFKGSKRLQNEMHTRCLITLDIDHIDELDIGLIEKTYEQYEYVLHSTMKHCSETPRLRLVFPLLKEIRPERYEPTARALANMLDMDCFDDTTFQPARIMFWPAVTSNGEIYKEHNEGAFVDAHGLCGSAYDDWTDFAEWPHSSRVKLRKPVKQAEDPLTKRGIIGAFNRTFDIHAAIARFELPYEQTEHDNRYRPLDATGPSGAVVYDDVFLYSHHESDVVAQQNVNAWDLVRLHKFGKQDSPHDHSDVPVMQWPSSKEMVALAVSIPEVDAELRRGLLDEVDNLDANGPDVSPAQSTLTFLGLREEISAINPNSKNLIEVCQSMIPRIAAAKLDPQDISVLAGTLHDMYPSPKPTKGSLERGIQIAGKRLTAQLSDGSGGISDIEQDLIQAVLDEHFEGGKTIKRIAKTYWTYAHGLWAMISDEPIRGKTIKTLSKLRQERPDDVLELVAAVGEAKTSTLSRALWDMQASILAERENRDDPLLLNRSFPLPLINCLNCELWFDATGTMKVHEHNPDNFLTIQIAAEWNPKAKCPEWDRFNNIIWSECVDPDDMQRHIEELGGYIIQMSRWLKTWVLFHGKKDTGKSTVSMVFQHLLGSAYTGKPMGKLASDSDVWAESALIGKLLMVDDDFAYNGHLPDGFLKTYSEEKAITASIKYGEDVNFKARCLPLILSNHWPVTRDITDAFLERAMIIPFTHRIRGRDRSDQRREIMLKELPGILNRFVAGLKRLRRRGDWDTPMDCLEATDEWKKHANPFLTFVSECLIMGGGDDCRVVRSRLYQIYIAWDQQQSGGANVRFRMKKGQFFERMDDLLGKPVKIGIYQYCGVSEKKVRIDELDIIEDDEF